MSRIEEGGLVHSSNFIWHTVCFMPFAYSVCAHVSAGTQIIRYVEWYSLTCFCVSECQVLMSCHVHAVKSTNSMTLHL